jgi:hypothetical protein
MFKRLIFPAVGLMVLTFANISSAGAAEEAACNLKMCRWTGSDGPYGTVECAATANHQTSHCTINIGGTHCPFSGPCID